MRRLLPLVLLAFVGVGTAQDKVAPKAKPPALPGTKDKEVGDIAGYERRIIEGFKVRINKKVFDQSFDGFEKKPFQVIEEELKGVARVIDTKFLVELKKVPIWLEWDDGVVSEGGGRTIAVYHGGSMMAYRLRPDPNLHPGKANQIEVKTLKHLSELKQPGKNTDQIILLHELIHAVHDKVLTRDYPDIRTAYDQAKQRGLYANVVHRRGPPREAYANTNHMEYFAEITCAYLDRIDYEPYQREGLKTHDPEGYKVVEKIWGKVVAKPKPDAKAKVVDKDKAKIPSEKPVPAAGDREKEAAERLVKLREINSGLGKDKVKERLGEFIKKYDGTQAANEAKEELEKLKS